MARTIPEPVWRAAALSAVALALASCVGPPVVVMKNPSTGELVKCGGAGGYPYAQDTWEARYRADAYSEQGWVRTN